MSSEFDNDDFRVAARLMEYTSCNLFLTGAAGTGKTTFLHRLRAGSDKRIVVAAPTGIAAVNAGGVTLHSLFQLEFGPFMPGLRRASSGHRYSKEKLRLIRSIDILVIDEISMVRADLLDAVDDVLRRLRDARRPFGGVQLLLIGDLQQLPPVVKDDEWVLLQNHYDTPYFFSSHALNRTEYCTIELTKVYRQSDPRFLHLLHCIRSGHVSQEIIEALNARYIPRFAPADGLHRVRLTTHNAIADSINASEMARLEGQSRIYKATVEGKFPENVLPADRELILKPGAQVIFIRNDASGEKRYYNGMLGTVTALREKSVLVLPEGEEFPIEVVAGSWENRRYEIDEQTQNVKEYVDGVFIQLPLRAAWAITIHKSQGLTFDRAIIDVAGAFASGQTYVALSRCRTLEGLVLSAPLRPESVITDPRVNRFIATTAARRPDDSRIKVMEDRYFLSLLDDLFDFAPLAAAYEDYRRTVDMAFHTLYPSVVRKYDETDVVVDEKITKVARVFRNQYVALASDPDASASGSRLQMRVKAAAAYFLDCLDELHAVYRDTPAEHDNKEIRKRLKNHSAAFGEALRRKLLLLGAAKDNCFTVAGYLRSRSRSFADADSAKKERKTKDTALRGARLKDASVVSEIQDSTLFAALKAWRLEESRRLGVPAFRILSTKALLNIANERPRTASDMLDIKYVGPATVHAYGDRILDIIRETEDNHSPQA